VLAPGFPVLTRQETSTSRAKIRRHWRLGTHPSKRARNLFTRYAPVGTLREAHRLLRGNPHLCRLIVGCKTIWKLDRESNAAAGGTIDIFARITASDIALVRSQIAEAGLAHTLTVIRVPVTEGLRYAKIFGGTGEIFLKGAQVSVTVRIPLVLSYVVIRVVWSPVPELIIKGALAILARMSFTSGVDPTYIW
jgi:hypothetical protein